MRFIVIVFAIIASVVVGMLFLLGSFAAFTPPNYGAPNFGTMTVLLGTLSYAVFGWYLAFRPGERKAMEWFIAVGCFCVGLATVFVFVTWSETTLSPAAKAELFEAH